MDPIIGSALIGGGASFLGGMFANKSNAKIAAMNNAFNATEALKTRTWNEGMAQNAMNFNSNQSLGQMQFQERMRGTQYTTAVEDMKNAGLNPMLAYGQGGAGGASGAMASANAPSGGQASSAGNPTMRDTISPAVQSAYRAAELAQTLDNMQKTNAKLEEETKLVRAQEREVQSRADLNNAQTNLSGHSAQNVQAQTGNVQEQTIKTIREANLIDQQKLTEQERTLLVEAQRRLTALQGLHEDKKISNTEANTELTNIQRILREFEVPGAKNLADYEKMLETGGGNAAKAAGAISTTIRRTLGK